MGKDGEAQGGRSVEILLVEDNPGDVELTREALHESKMANNLHVVSDGEQALDYLRRRGGHEGASRPDLVLLDLNLPRKDGREVLDEIKSDPGLRSIPVVVLTTSKDEADVARTYMSHANCYITKPIDFTQFITVVQAIENFWFSIVMLPPKR